MVRLHNPKHPELGTVQVSEGTAEVLADSGWEPASEFVQSNPALAPGEVEPKPEPKRRTTTSKT